MLFYWTVFQFCRMSFRRLFKISLTLSIYCKRYANSKNVDFTAISDLLFINFCCPCATRPDSSLIHSSKKAVFRYVSPFVAFWNRVASRQPALQNTCALQKINKKPPHRIWKKSDTASSQYYSVCRSQFLSEVYINSDADAIPACICRFFYFYLSLFLLLCLNGSKVLYLFNPD